MAMGPRAMTKWRNRYGPWALVTGASDGIGCAMARELAARKLNVILVARRELVLEKLAIELEQGFGVKSLVLAADLSNRAEISRIAAETTDLDIGLLAACAGFGTSGRFLGIDIEAELGMIDVNCRAVLEMSRVFAERFVKRKRGGIVLLSSIVAFQGVPNASNYAATKAYIQTLAEGLRSELASSGVDVISSSPGPVDSGFAVRSNMRMGSTVTPHTVARETLDALGRTTTVRPGLLSKILIGSLAPLPRFARTAIMGQIMAGMTKHQNGRKGKAV